MVTPPTDARAPEQNRYLIQAAAGTLEVLLVFAQAPHRFTPSEVAQHLTIDRNQAFRCLRTLQHVGFVRLDVDDRFVLTGLVEQLAAASQGQPTLLAAAGDAMDELSRQTGETVNLFALDGLEALYVDHRDGIRPVRLIASVAERRALHAGACPKAMLSALPDSQIGEVLAALGSLPRYTDWTELDPSLLRSELQLTRERGYAVSDLDVDEEARGVGAAILGPQGRVLGAVSVGGPAFRITPGRLPELGTLIVAAARQISRQLGYSGQSQPQR